ncbi:MAG: sugar nucleotide-binding protein [Elusimicrobia bacterium]|nr:sugar nucleotide-binding protein [Elusimicrobiota bacterium]
MRILLTGATGMLGRAAARRLGAVHEVIGAARGAGPVAGLSRLEPLDLADAAAGAALLERVRPDAVIHAGALAKPDHCEREPAATAAVNVTATGALARAAAKAGARFYFLSTEQIMKGDAPPYGDDAVPAPLHAYGRQKAAAEDEVRASGADHLILRVSLCYGFAEPGTVPGFCDELRAALSAGKPVKAFSDQYRSMLLVEDAVELLCRAVEKGLPPDGRRVLNLAGPGPVRRSDFAAAFAETFGFEGSLVVPTPSAQSGLAAPRPADCSLDGARLWAWTGFTPRGTREGLARLKG